MGYQMKLVLLGFLLLLSSISTIDGAIPSSFMKKVREVNKKGPYLGIVVPNSFEMSPLLQSSSFVADEKLAYLDFAGRRFRFGKIESKKVIIVMTGLSMLNAGIATELLLTLFRVKGVVHYGIAGNANPQLQIGDVTIPQYWAHTGLWYWQRYGEGINDALTLESSGDYTRSVGFLNYSDYTVDETNGKSSANLLNSVWYQPEEIFPVNGTPEVRQHAFWVPVNSHYFAIAKKIGNLTLEGCVNSTCLPRKPEVFIVERGCSANVFVDNAAYRQFLNTKFNVTPIDMESAAVALISLQEGIPFIAIRGLSDLAGGGSAVSNEAGIFASLAAQNSVDVVVRFIALL
ncbi:bark storage protein A isoform X1 [Macadamia integrifolia]|uniref:bark storage protein A isoform X1 n=1 Tax=Macadamia integrifolia TaxID=60698 RepID=UPI001C4F492E|nr:bark storage protein A isoform X1 [Macadamia integrifolia]